MYTPAGHTVDQMNQEYLVEIFDSGADGNEELRYRCVTTKPGAEPKGWQATESIEKALLNVRWDKLD